MDRSHLMAIFSAFFVTILWSSSWVLIKIGLHEINPLLFAAIRYVCASLILLAMVLGSTKHRSELRSLSPDWWPKLLLYGILFYSVTQGAQFIALNYLPAITVSFVLNLTTILVLLISIPLLGEYPSRRQLLFVLLGLLGVILFFFPLDLSATTTFGLIAIGIGVVANALSTILGRSLNQTQQVSPLVITAVSMTMGSVILLVTALVTEGIASLSRQIILIIIWLAVVNTALAFVIWNKSLQQLLAVEASIINSTMLPQITILAMIFFDERLSLKQWIGLLLIFTVALLLPLTRRQDSE